MQAFNALFSLFLHGLLPSRKEARDGLRVSSGHLFAKQRSNDRAGRREIELVRAPRARLCKKWVPVKVPVFCTKRARDGDRMTIILLTKKCLNPFIYRRFAVKTKQRKDIKKAYF